jgi:hypothetical protein
MATRQAPYRFLRAAPRSTGIEECSHRYRLSGRTRTSGLLTLRIPLKVRRWLRLGAVDIFDKGTAHGGHARDRQSY